MEISGETSRLFEKHLIFRPTPTTISTGRGQGRENAMMIRLPSLRGRFTTGVVGARVSRSWVRAVRSRASMQWQDRVYGDVSIEDPAILDLVSCPTFERLKGIRQAGPSALTFPFKDVTRFEHSLGVFILL